MPSKKKKDDEKNNNGEHKNNGELHKIIKFTFLDNSLKSEKDIWTAIVEAYNKKYNANLPTTTDNLQEILESHSKKYDVFFSKSIKIAIMQIIAGIIDIIKEAINRINQTGLENLDEKEMIIVIEKMSLQIKILADLYQKLFKSKDEDDDEEKGFDIKIL